MTGPLDGGPAQQGLHRGGVDHLVRSDPALDGTVTADVLPIELARVDVLLDDPVFFVPFIPFFDPRMGRPSTPMETYLRLMFLKFRYRLRFESLCREVSDSITR